MSTQSKLILEIVNWLKEQADSQEGGPSSNLMRTAALFTSLRTRLEAAEMELEKWKASGQDLDEENKGLAVALSKAKQANAELVKDRATLTLEEIKDLAKFAGYEVGDNITDQESDTEITIEPCPVKGVKDGDGTSKHYRHIAYLDEYPEEGVYPLGQAIDAAITKGTV